MSLTLSGCSCGPIKSQWRRREISLFSLAVRSKYQISDGRGTLVRSRKACGCRAEAQGQKEAETSNRAPDQPGVPVLDVNKEVTKFARGAATTFAPRPSGATKNPAYKGSLLYTIFEVQAWASLVVGGLLSFNLLFPSDKPDIARLMGMWSIWMFTVPSLRARDCSQPEKDALNILFLLIPIINVSLPFVWKNFGFIYAADVVALAAILLWKLGPPSLPVEAPPNPTDSQSS